MPPRRHRQLRRRLDAFVDGELHAERDRWAVIAHLLECERCREQVRFLEALKASLRRLGRPRPVPHQ